MFHLPEQASIIGCVAHIKEIELLIYNELTTDVFWSPQAEGHKLLKLEIQQR